MATKTKAPAGSVYEHAEIQKALKAIKEAKNALGAGFALSARATSYVLEAEAALSEAASRLRDLLKGKVHRCSPRQRKGTVPSRRKHVDGSLQKVSRLRASKRKAESRKGLPREPSDPHWFPKYDYISED